MKLTDKYNAPVPRYTSYPPANFFESNQPARYISVIESSQKRGEDISLYFHFPFCRHLCHYCGCNSIAMVDDSVTQRYLAALEREIQMVLPLLGEGRKISQIHFGGGTPTLLPLENLARLIAPFTERFGFTTSPEIAIECHPAYMDEEYVSGLASIGFNRVSIGIQDFDLQVLKGVNRHPSLLPIEQIFKILRSQGISINLDFIYGLPHQSVDTFRSTIERAITLSPDRLVTFSYAHVPWVNARQIELERAGLPSAEQKSQMYDVAKELLQKAGYVAIGLDHFVQENDELYIAYQNGQLRRNFQGYSVLESSSDVYAFGLSAISQLKGGYFQNEKSLDRYISKIEAGELAYDKGYLLNENQQIISAAISMLMCNRLIVWSELAQQLSVSIQQIWEAMDYRANSLAELERDGIVTTSDDRIWVTDLGAKFIRNVAAAIDPLMRTTDKRYSKSL